jgi:diacylglycerol kinase (ATP)
VPAIELIVNPVAGRGAAAALAPAVAARLRACGLAGEPRYTAAPRDATTLVADALRRGARCVAVAGGDGTFNEAVNGYIGVARESQALALIPVGTGNDFAKMLGVSGDWQLACDRVAQASFRRVDAGRCNARYFANGIGAGFDAQVALEASAIRWLRGNAVYGAALARTLMLRYSTPHMRIAHDGGVLERRVTLVAAANGASYGGAFRMAPEASITDGLLELVVADALSRLGILGFVPHVMRGTHLGRPGVTALRTRRVLLESAEPLVVHADGEIVERAATRLDIEALPGALLVAA